jgi:5-methylcytosine-specific restriction endonuclease McrA
MHGGPVQHALLLNADYQPLRIVSWERAMLLLLDDRAELVERYVDRFVRSVTAVFPWPAVLRLKRFVHGAPRVRFTRWNVLARDGYRCAYCGNQPTDRRGQPYLEDLTLDHVVPRAQAKKGYVKSVAGVTVPITCWENVVTACLDCNLEKADRTPAQCGFKLRVQPRVPTTADALRMSLRRVAVPQEWVQWLPVGAAQWSNYWTEELDQQ